MTSSLKLEIYDKDIGQVDVIQGSVIIQLKSLENQLLVDKWFNLGTSTGTTEEGQIRLRLQLIWSKFNYYQSLVHNADEKMNKIKNEIDVLNKYLDLFEKPFGILLYVEIDLEMVRKMWGEETEQYNPQLTSTSLPKIVNLNGTVRSSIIATTLGNVIRGTFLSNPIFYKEKARIEWNKMTKIIMYIVVLFSFVNLLGRSDFVNVLKQLKLVMCWSLGYIY